ncbi:MAG: MoaD/ThiS family protein [Pirellulaceae bacterium]|jgi:molybdopterin converting factor small subunit|nr:MoaD/ThiS family protein [Pirellulaceae bacterium]HJN09655.1 MoaD/ThiS family protein [Pirellulaceae bacterium]
MKIRITYLGRSYQHAETLPEQIDLESGATIASAVQAVNSLLAETNLPGSCLVTVSGEHVGSVASFTDRPMREGEELVLIAPVAGG